MIKSLLHFLMQGSRLIHPEILRTSPRIHTTLCEHTCTRCFDRESSFQLINISSLGIRLNVTNLLWPVCRFFWNSDQFREYTILTSSAKQSSYKGSLITCGMEVTGMGDTTLYVTKILVQKANSTNSNASLPLQ